MIPSGISGGGPGWKILEAEQRPLVGYSAGLSRAWEAKIEGDLPAEEPRRSRFPATAAAIVASLFVTLFFAGREGAVQAAPDLAGLYAAAGLSVNLTGLALNDLQAVRTGGAKTAPVLLRGTIRNLGRLEQRVPQLTARLFTMEGGAAGTRTFEPPEVTIAPGGTMPFEFELASVVDEAAEIVLRFRRPEEPVVISTADLDTE